LHDRPKTRRFQKQYDKALVTSKEMIKIKPHTPEFYQQREMLYALVDDNFSADKYFQAAQTL